MLLLIDIGNSNITAGLYSNGCIQSKLRLKTLPEGRNSEEYSYIVSGFMRKNSTKKPVGAVISSVVPEVTAHITKALKRSFGITPIIVTHKIKTGLKFLRKGVRTLGADRIANAVAAGNLYKGNVIIVDFGTATTVCAVTKKGEYMGGTIMPGIGICVNALSEKTSLLPSVKLKMPERILGNDTSANICAGVILGHAGGVERIINRMAKEVKGSYTVVATGGFADLVTPHIKADHVNPDLTLEGLRIIYEIISKS
jgi:type III pantothenate kinase